jgi:enterochelin esterase-like enzyme
MELTCRILSLTSARTCLLKTACPPGPTVRSKDSIRGQITGTLRYQRALKGAGIKDRDLVVWLPPDYEADQTRRYPVIYMHDGQNILDSVTSSFGTDWSVDETADDLIRKKSIEPVIVVGIYNTSDRMKEYTPGDKGTAYMDFVVKTVKPLIDSTYRTKADRKNTIVGGSSASGIMSFMLVWEHADVFSKAICMSPAFKSISRAVGITRASFKAPTARKSSFTSTTAAWASSRNSNPASTRYSPHSRQRNTRKEKTSSSYAIQLQSTSSPIGPSASRARW